MQTSPIQTSKERKVQTRERIAWYLYDFGNSAYASIVLLAVYAAYFKNTVVGGAQGSFLWGISVGIAMLVVALISPLLGAIADYSSTKKRMLVFFTSTSVLFTGLLFFVQKGDVMMGMVFFIFAEIGYRGGQIFYNALLPEVSDAEEMGRISGYGWAIGSAGGVICLLIVFVLIKLIGGDFITRFSLVIAALFFAFAAIPLFLWLKERKEPQPHAAGSSYLLAGYRRLRQTFIEARKYREFIKFLVAYLVFNNGVIMMLNFAAIIGSVLFGMTQSQLVILMLIVQVTSVFGAYVFGIIADRIGGKTALGISIILMIAAVTILLFVQNVTIFFVIAALAGFSLTGVQSVSRSMVAQLSPEGKYGEFYGLFAVAGLVSASLGPAVYGWLASNAARWFQGNAMSVLAAEQSGQRVAIISMALFLTVGLILLRFVRAGKVQSAAKQG